PEPRPCRPNFRCRALTRRTLPLLSETTRSTNAMPLAVLNYEERSEAYETEVIGAASRGGRCDKVNRLVSNGSLNSILLPTSGFDSSLSIYVFFAARGFVSLQGSLRHSSSAFLMSRLVSTRVCFPPVLTAISVISLEAFSETSTQSTLIPWAT